MDLLLSDIARTLNASRVTLPMSQAPLTASRPRSRNEAPVELESEFARVGLGSDGADDEGVASDAGPGALLMGDAPAYRSMSMLTQPRRMGRQLA